DVETGQVLWTRLAPSAAIEPLAPGGRFHRAFLVTRERVLIQTSRGRQWLLDSATGKIIHDGGGEARGTWLQPPVLLNEQQAGTVPDGRHISLIELATGDEIWRHE